jgi:hypothetical protein
MPLRLKSRAPQAVQDQDGCLLLRPAVLAISQPPQLLDGRLGERYVDVSHAPMKAGV